MAPRKRPLLTPEPKLPDLEKLRGMTPEKLVATLKKLNLAPDVAELRRAADRVFDRVSPTLAKGQWPDDATWKAIERSSERELESELRRQTKQAIQRYRFDRLSEVEKFIWIAVCSDSCQSCLSEHGGVRGRKEWRSRGGPGSTRLLCGRECRCTLQPYLDEDIFVEISVEND